MKKLVIGLTVAMLLVIGIVSAVETTADVTWDGGGNVMGEFYSGDDQKASFSTGGATIEGEFHAKDKDDNPYTYGVDTSYANIDATVAGGGFIIFQVDRFDSKASYGAPGQQTYSWVSSDDGTAEMAWYTVTNYAAMSNCQYAKPTTTNGKNFEASGSAYLITHSVTDADLDGAFVTAYGAGSAMIKLQGEKASGSSFNMGSLPICGDGCAWDNNYATFSGTGSGNFDVQAKADNGLSVCADCAGKQWNIPGDGTDDSATYALHVGYAGSWSMPDFGIKGN